MCEQRGSLWRSFVQRKLQRNMTQDRVGQLLEKRGEVQDSRILRGEPAPQRRGPVCSVLGSVLVPDAPTVPCPQA